MSPLNMKQPVAHATDYLDQFRPYLEITSIGNSEVGGLCPFHNDTRPSFSLNRRNGLWKCHGCGESGNAIQLLHRLRQPVAIYDYVDRDGQLLYQVLRYEPKAFLQRRPDGDGGWTWNLEGVRRVPYRLPELNGQPFVFLTEGEADVDRLRSFGLPATTNSGGAGKWREEYVEELKAAGVQQVVILPDNDKPGCDHAVQVARSCLKAGLKVKIINLPDLPEKGDVSDWLDAGHGLEELRGLARMQPLARLEDLPAEDRRRVPWTTAEPAPEFVSSSETDPEWVEPHFLAPGSITEMFSPRGICKTHVAHALAVKLALQGKRVLLLDRDNSRREVRRRLRAWGAAQAPTLKVLTRDQCPPLTDAEAWKAFPLGDYDVVVIDSLDSSAEGIGEKDSSKPSRAIAPILDLAHREHGPAILVLGNTVRTGAHSRGSGVIEDRADICFEVRDATDFTPTGKKPWWLELPAASAADWGERAARRKRRTTYRLAFVPSKFRVGQEPEPFLLELHLPDNAPWTMRDVTEEVDQKAVADLNQYLDEMAGALKAEISSRQARGEDPLTLGKATDFLEGLGMGRNEAANFIKDRVQRDWWLEELKDRPGKPKVLRLVTIPSVQQVKGGQSKTAGEIMPPSQMPRKTMENVRGISPTRISTEREKPRVRTPASRAGINDGGLFLPDQNNTGEVREPVVVREPVPIHEPVLAREPVLVMEPVFPRVDGRLIGTPLQKPDIEKLLAEGHSRGMAKRGSQVREPKREPVLATEPEPVLVREPVR